MKLTLAGALPILVSGLHGPHSILQAQQAPPAVAHCRVQIVNFKAFSRPNLLVEIRNSRSGVPESIREISSGIFEFTVPEGEAYVLTVTSEQHDFAQRHTISGGAGCRQLVISLNPRLDPDLASRLDSGEQPRVTPAKTSIAVRQLLIPAKATKEFGRSEKAFQSGDPRTSIEHLEKAIQIYPDYAEAHNNLGARFIASDQYDKAVAECQKAIALDPNATKPYQNLSVAFALLHRYPEAEVAARRAMQLDPNSVHIRYVLGRLLSAQEINTSETVELLRKPAMEIPNARMLLVHVLLRRGEVDQAVAELQEYLKSPNAPNKQQAGCWLAHLRQIPAGPHCGSDTNTPKSTP